MIPERVAQLKILERKETKIGSPYVRNFQDIQYLEYWIRKQYPGAELIKCPGKPGCMASDVGSVDFANFPFFKKCSTTLAAPLKTTQQLFRPEKQTSQRHNQ